MGRRRKENGDWFAHYHSPSNAKIIRYLTRTFGGDGYMFYYRMLEVLTRSNNFKYSLQNDMDRSLLAEEVGLPDERFNEIYNKCLELTDEEGEPVFVHHNNYIYSPWLLCEMESLVRKREINRANYEEQKNDKTDEPETDTKPKPDFSDRKNGKSPISTSESAQRREEESREDERTGIDLSQKEKQMRWNMLKRGGLLSPVLTTARLFCCWDPDLKDDLEKPLPPDDRILMVDIISNVRRQLPGKAAGMIRAAIDNLSNDNWRKENGYASIRWLLDMDKGGERAIQRIRDFGGEGKTESGKWFVDTLRRGAVCSCGKQKKIYLFKKGQEEIKRIEVCEKCEPEKIPKNQKETATNGDY